MLANRAHARIRSRGERAIATLKNWKILAKLRCCPRRATPIAQAILVLHHIEANRCTGGKAVIGRQRQVPSDQWPRCRSRKAVWSAIACSSAGL